MSIKKLDANEVFEVNGRYYQISENGSLSDLGIASSFKARPVNYESLNDGDEYFVMMKKGQEDLFLKAEKKFVSVKMEDQSIQEILAEEFDDSNESQYLGRWFLVKAVDLDYAGDIISNQRDYFYEETHYPLPESFTVKLPEEK